MTVKYDFEPAFIVLMHKRHKILPPNGFGHIITQEQIMAIGGIMLIKKSFLVA